MLVGLIVVDVPRAQGPPPAARPGGTGGPGGSGGQIPGGPLSGDLELVERLLVSRRDYQRTLEQLRAHYLNVGDVKRARLAEDELRQFHRIAKHPFRLELDVPPPTLHPTTNVPDANRLYTRAMEFKNRGYGTDYLDNQRRAEILFQEVLTRYPQSNKISDTAYQLGDIYESKAYKQYDRAAAYFERCFQWNPNTHLDARIRAARLYDKQLQERGRAIEIYREVTTHETDAKRIQEAGKRLGDLSANPR
jgi:tetratricopeptide (TPR) repeat protein